MDLREQVIAEIRKIYDPERYIFFNFLLPRGGGPKYSYPDGVGADYLYLIFNIKTGNSKNFTKMLP